MDLVPYSYRDVLKMPGSSKQQPLYLPPPLTGVPCPFTLTGNNSHKEREVNQSHENGFSLLPVNWNVLHAQTSFIDYCVEVCTIVNHLCLDCEHLLASSKQRNISVVIPPVSAAGCANVKSVQGRSCCCSSGGSGRWILCVFDCIWIGCCCMLSPSSLSLHLVVHLNWSCRAFELLCSEWLSSRPRVLLNGDKGKT